MTAPQPSLRVERPEQLLRDRVTEVLREAILRGDLEPGRRLTERELGEMTGVSRTSLREALRHLQAEGLVEPSEGRGLQVAVLTESIVNELYDVRAVLEPAAVEMFIRSANDQDLGALRDLLAEATGDLENQLDAIRRFYKVLLDGTGNPTLQQMFGSIEVRIHALRRLSLLVPGRAEVSRREFQETLRWIEQRNTARAARAARSHVLAAKKAALEAVRGTGTSSAS